MTAPAPDGFSVSAAIDGHIATVDALAQRLATLATTAGHALPPSAFRVVCTVFGQSVVAQSATASAAVAGWGTALAAIADGLRADRAAYAGVERDNTDRFRDGSDGSGPR